VTTLEVGTGRAGEWCGQEPTGAEYLADPECSALVVLLWIFFVKID